MKNKLSENKNLSRRKTNRMQKLLMGTNKDFNVVDKMLKVYKCNCNETERRL